MKDSRDKVFRSIDCLRTLCVRPRTLVVLVRYGLCLMSMMSVAVSRAARRVRNIVIFRWIGSDDAAHSDTHLTAVAQAHV
jgi:hypothetical protein